MDAKKKDLEKTNNMERNGNGSSLQESGSVGIDEAKTEGTKGGRVRRATFDDLDAIMDINDNIYYGFDYLPSFFYHFMQSKLHVIYVYEEDGKLISLANFRFHPDCDDLVTVMSGRVHPSHVGRGLGFAPSSVLFTQLLNDHQAIKRYVIDHLCTEKLSAKMHGKNVNYHWNTLVYKLADRQWLSRFTRIRQMAFDANRPFILSYTSGTEWLERSDQLIRFISKYVKDLFPIGPDLMPKPANRSGLRHVLSCSNVCISMDRSSSSDNGSSTFSTVCGSDRTVDRGQEGDIVGLSYSTGCPCKYGIRFDIFFYGDCEKVFLSHVYSHLRHYNSITLNDVRFGVVLHFPQTIDLQNVEELLMDEMGERVRDYGATQAVQYIVNLPS